MNELKTFCIWTPFNTIQVIIGFKQSSLTVSHDRMILLIWSHMLCDPHTLLFWSWPLGGTQSPRYCVWKSKQIWSSPGSRTDRCIQSHIHGRVLSCWCLCKRRWQGPPPHSTPPPSSSVHTSPLCTAPAPRRQSGRGERCRTGTRHSVSPSCCPFLSAK